MNYQVTPIGKIENNEEGTFLQLEPKYISALEALDDFRHINVLWWFDAFDDDASRNLLVAEQPYKNAPEQMGVFATRSPLRPNPIALTACEILAIDMQNGRIQLAFIDANDNSPVLDIKPYTPSLDRIESPSVPDWCSSWPMSLEESGDFNWGDVFNF